MDKLEQVGDAAVRAVLSTLALLYALKGIADNSGDFLKVRTVAGAAMRRPQRGGACSLVSVLTVFAGWAADGGPGHAGVCSH